MLRLILPFELFFLKALIIYDQEQLKYGKLCIDPDSNDSGTIERSY